MKHSKSYPHSALEQRSIDMLNGMLERRAARLSLSLTVFGVVSLFDNSLIATADNYYAACRYAQAFSKPCIVCTFELTKINTQFNMKGK